MTYGSTRLIARSLWRSYRSQPGQLALALIGIAIGVAAVVSVELSSNALNRSFQKAAADLDGRATHRILSDEEGISPQTYARLRREFGYVPMAPIIERQILVDDQLWTLLGVDPLAEGGFGRAASASDKLPEGWYAGTGGVLIPDRRDLASLQFLLGEDHIDSEVTGAFAVASESRIAIADLSQVSQWTRSDLLDRVDVVATNAALEQLEQGIADLGLRIEAASQSGPELTRAFELNLFSLGLLMTFVGILIVYNTLQFQIVKRHLSFATLAALGVSPRQLRRWTRGEILFLAACGAGLGLALGRGIAEFTLAAMEQTVNDLYVAVKADIAMTLKATAVGIAVVLAAAAPAAWRLGLRSEELGYRQSRSSRASGVQLLLVAAVAVVSGALLLSAEELSLPTALAGMFCVAGGYAAAVAPLFGIVLGRIQRWVSVTARPTLALAARRLPRTFFSTTPAVAALVLAMATVIGVGTMVTGFKDSVERWLGESLSADYYVGSRTVLPSAAIARLESLEAVASTTLFHTRRAQTSQGNVELSLQQLTPRAREGVRFLDDPQDAWARFDSGDVFISQSFSTLGSVSVNDSLDVDLPCGRRTVVVAAVIEDYRAGGGRVIGDWNALNDGCQLLATSMGLELASMAEAGDVERELGRLLADFPQLRFTATTNILTLSLQVFDRTFALTNALKWIAGLVALIGLTGALSAIELGRAPELALLGRLGLNRRERRQVLFFESGMLGIWCAVAAIPLGVLLGWILCTVINPRAFGWTIEFVLQPLPIVQSLGIAVAGSLGAALLASRGKRE